MPHHPVISDKKEYKNYYFKHTANKMPQISGLPLPNYENGTVSDCRFVDCDFHPDCWDVTFINCEFINCNLTGIELMKKLKKK